MEKPCPKCERVIPASAVRCRCGWEAPQARNDYIACCFAGCPTSATIRKLLKTGWANICEHHAMHLAQKSADDYCAERGLHTVTQKRAWLLANTKGSMRKMIERQPGEDGEEIAA